MNRITKVVVATIFFLSAPAVLACDYPSRPGDLPDGSTATKEEMLAGLKAVNAYQVAMQEYLDCIEADEVVVAVATMDDVGRATKQKRSALFDKKYNAAVNEMTLTVEKFNVQIRDYKKRQD